MCVCRRHRNAIHTFPVESRVISLHFNPELNTEQKSTDTRTEKAKDKTKKGKGKGKSKQAEQKDEDADMETEQKTETDKHSLTYHIAAVSENSVVSIWQWQPSQSQSNTHVTVTPDCQIRAATTTQAGDAPLPSKKDTPNPQKRGKRNKGLLSIFPCVSLLFSVLVSPDETRTRLRLRSSQRPDSMHIQLAVSDKCVCSPSSPHQHAFACLGFAARWCAAHACLALCVCVGRTPLGPCVYR